MKAGEIQAYLRSLNGGWMDLDNTVDTFKAGTPDTEVRGVAVGWMTYTWALQNALSLGCNVFVTHEPTYYDHYDKDERIFNLPGVEEKRRFIQENDLVIIRCNDLWDQYPGIGIADSWGDWLGLGVPIAGEGYYRVYAGDGRTALQIARQVAERTAPLGQEAVLLIGPQDKPVRRLAIGTGAITPFLAYIRDYEADLGLCTDDGIQTWQAGAYAIDMGVPLIIVNHPVSEEAGMINLAARLREKYTEIPVHHIPQRCMYHLVRI